MKTMKRPVKQKSFHYLLVCLALVFSSHALMADQVDIGIFKSESNPNEIEIRMRPDFTIDAGETITNIQYTIRWRTTDPDITTLNLVTPYNIPYGAQFTNDGYIYQNFVTAATIEVTDNIDPMDEVVISTFTYPGGAMYFEIINDQFTIDNEIEYYFEMALTPPDVTGIIYRPIVSIPLALWGLILGFGMMLAFVIYRFRKLI